RHGVRVVRAAAAGRSVDARRHAPETGLLFLSPWLSDGPWAAPQE
ncbi:hypothetical protein GTY54_34260, partial [Streptomyces sp. SID625]|nr:hypothetical protein [Streptomyces sp. SID625]